jgi:hypothetical protein
MKGAGHWHLEAGRVTAPSTGSSAWEIGRPRPRFGGGATEGLVGFTARRPLRSRPREPRLPADLVGPGRRHPLLRRLPARPARGAVALSAGRRNGLLWHRGERLPARRRALYVGRHGAGAPFPTAPPGVSQNAGSATGRTRTGLPGDGQGREPSPRLPASGVELTAALSAWAEQGHRRVSSRQGRASLVSAPAPALCCTEEQNCKTPQN